MNARNLSLIGLLSALPYAAQAAEVPAVETGLILASGAQPSLGRSASAEVPPSAKAAWNRFLEEVGPTWRGSFDPLTGAPIRVYGKGLEAPGSMASAEVAERHARAFLERHVDLLAPGAKASELELAADHSDGQMRTLGFVQTHRGLRVFGGQVSLRYKNDRLFMVGSEALAGVALEPAARVISDEAAAEAAKTWLVQSLGPRSLRVEANKGRLILPVRTDEGLRFHDVIDVRVRTERPVGLYAVYVDATSGEPVARRQLLMFTSGQVSFNVPTRWPGAERTNRVVPGLSVGISGSTVVTDNAGTVVWTGVDPTPIQLGVSGPLVAIANQAGVPTSTTTMLAPMGNFVWNASASELNDAQLISFISSQDVKAYLRNLVPNMPWLNGQLTVNTNINDVCNAFSDGQTTNFFKSGMGCENTGRLPDVVDHESGHTIHFNAIIDGVGNFDTSLSEGVSDYLAATMHEDPQMGRGFFFTDEPLRDIDPANVEKQWPADIARDPHETGLIIAGALWDLRKAYVQELGHDPGVTKTDLTWFAILQRASDIPSTYAEAIAFDDDDGDLSNGTPHLCLINAAFSKHGLVDKVNNGPGVGIPSYDASTRTVSFPFMPHDSCPGSNITAATIDWVQRDDTSVTGSVNMSMASGGGSMVGVLPEQNAPRVLTYKVQMTFDDGSSLAFPDNPADPSYQVFIGSTIELYCTDFENDPAGDGWSHMLTAGMPAGMSMPADDWQWGPAQSLPGSSDPASAFSGTNVIGNDLGIMGGAGRIDGRYGGNQTTALLSPMIDVMGHTQVHLQFRRWLTVEDGLNDQARIYGGDSVLWKNLASPMASDPLLQVLVNHIDKEWRFVDVDLSNNIVDGKVHVKFEMQSNRRRSFGGWTIDDFCVVAIPICGNGSVEPGEECDDSNTTDGDGCSSSCRNVPLTPVCGNSKVEMGEQCDDGVNDGTHCTSTCQNPPPAPVCGNGMVEMGEQCDDGVNDGTHCTSTCTTPLTTVKSGGCGCSASDPREGAFSAMALLLVGFLGRRRKR